MTCNWLFLASRTAPERLCGGPGHPYCEEHQTEINYIRGLDNDWKEIEATHKGTRGFQVDRLQRDAGGELSEPTS